MSITDPMSDNETPSGFLSHFRAECRGKTANYFYAAVRDGCTEPRAACSRVFRSLTQRVKERGRRDQGCDAGEVIEWLQRDKEGALAFAAEVIAREQLDPEERSQQKEAIAEAGRREWMAKQPATEKQKALLGRLGYSGEIQHRLHASEMIEKMKDW